MTAKKMRGLTNLKYAAQTNLRNFDGAKNRKEAMAAGWSAGEIDAIVAEAKQVLAITACDAGVEKLPDFTTSAGTTKITVRNADAELPPRRKLGTGNSW